MSVKATKSNATGTELSEKFTKDLNKFFKWAESVYEIKDSNEVEIERDWNMKLLKNFEEPGRNKLDAYVKELMKKYKIYKDSELIDDYKVIVKEFKNKPKRKRVETDSSEPSEAAQEVKAQKEIVVDNSLDTADAYYLDTLEFDTNTLLKKFGKPQKNDNEKNRFEWKLKVGDNVYSIYDWLNEDGEFDAFADATWHICGFSSNKKDIAAIIKHLKQQKTKKQKVEEVKADNELTESDEELINKVKDFSIEDTELGDNDTELGNDNDTELGNDNENELELECEKLEEVEVEDDVSDISDFDLETV